MFCALAPLRTLHASVSRIKMTFKVLTMCLTLRKNSYSILIAIKCLAPVFYCLLIKSCKRCGGHSQLLCSIGREQLIEENTPTQLLLA